MKNNFSRILGERLLKVSDVYKHTRISKTTLTEIYYQRSENIQMSTLVKICDFLDIRLSDLIEYDPTAKMVSK